MTEKKTKNPAIDIIANNIKARRISAGFSQEAVGKKLGITFQQIQKYEKGTNRVSADKLPLLAALYGCSVMDFYQGVTGVSDLPPAPIISKADVEINDLLTKVPRSGKEHLLGIIRLMKAA